MACFSCLPLAINKTKYFFSTYQIYRKEEDKEGGENDCCKLYKCVPTGSHVGNPLVEGGSTCQPPH